MADSTGTFCPACGEPVDPEADRGQAGTRRERALCDACYFDRFDLVDAPSRVELTVCGSCGAIKRDASWEDVGARDHTDVAIEAVSEVLGVHADAESVSWRVEPEQVDETTIRMHCEFSGVVRGTALEAAVTVPVKLGTGTCDRCGRIAGDYYAAEIQLRAEGRDPTQSECDRAVELARNYVAERTAAGDRNAFVTEVAEVAGGVDIKLSATQMAQGIAGRIERELGGETTHTRTLVTEDEDGAEVYRSTFAIRLPRHTPGDVIEPRDGDGPVLVRSVSGALKGVRLTTGEQFEADAQAPDAVEATPLGAREDAVETTLVTVEDDHAAQVLDPETQAAVTVPRPSYLDPDVTTVQVLKSSAGLHVLPPAESERP
ncbi:MAG: 60S ribosomal export protein NMD3 [Halobacteriaceae archaeon]